MAEIRAQRRLAAILAADVVGYSRLMEHDEAGTLAALKARRNEVLSPTVAQHHGRVVKVMGDGVLVEFGSAVDAVQCAVELQKGFNNANLGAPETSRIILRIGVNLGDVIVEGSDIYGDGVNVAARLEGLAEPGGIYVSSTVHEHVTSKLALAFDDLGEHTLKNIVKPVRVYCVGMNVSGKSGEHLAVTLPDKPSIAVLPFANMSGDPEQEYFSDGITEDIITDLSQVSGLSVVARNTVFTFKGKAVLIEEVAKKLNVAYVLEGSVRKAGGRVRITAQLINGRGGDHVWAERYDRTLDDIFNLQDEISKTIVDVLKVKLLPEELKTITNRSTDNPEAYEALLMGRSFLYSGVETRLMKAAQRLFAKAIEIDPNYARAYAALADCEVHLLIANDPDASYEAILANSTRALELEPGLADAHASRGGALFIIGRYAEAEAEFERALALDASSFEAHFFYGRNCLVRGQYEKALTLFQRAASLSPDDYRVWTHLEMVYVSLGRSDDAKEAARQGVLRVEKEIKAHPDNSSALCFGAIMLAEIGEADRALSWASRAEMFAGDSIQIQYNLGCYYAKLGKSDKAIDCLERQLTASHAYLLIRLPWMQQDSDLDPIRTHPRFVALVDRMKAQIAATEA
ncbi:adenylate/guanylate cyclase domain-containing protein [Mesorhizobium sp. B2-4-17]|uniref:adenylate/guanylate cyclase domain-containing protein n=1 Tax=Mesorhizobium sp. B2-4-17 TaxID=2589932 RepID=UPI00112966B9|nr:adenylate/guanylate cyclase domain-containing protein [Mesorhizobium sp. B2-4-17]TPK90032.1 tetratricopeptide repeat protein [Mesorhizobium sp. B2-4-17]